MLIALLLAAAESSACPMPRLDFRAAEDMSVADRASFTRNFRIAVEQACADGIFKTEPLVDERSYEKDLIYVMTAAEANITSIYFGPSAAPPATLMEVPFGPGRQVPAVEDLREAIHCWIKGATPEEEEKTGRCLPD